MAFCSRPEAGKDVISGAHVEQVGMDVRVKSGDSRSNRSRDGLPYFVTNDDDAGLRRSSHQGKSPYGVLLKNHFARPFLS